LRLDIVRHLKQSRKCCAATIDRKSMYQMTMPCKIDRYTAALAFFGNQIVCCEAIKLMPQTPQVNPCTFWSIGFRLLTVRKNVKASKKVTTFKVEKKAFCLRHESFHCLWNDVKFPVFVANSRW
jgi:hypothetical protein